MCVTKYCQHLPCSRKYSQMLPPRSCIFSFVHFINSFSCTFTVLTQKNSVHTSFITAYLLHTNLIFDHNSNRIAINTSTLIERTCLSVCPRRRSSSCPLVSFFVSVAHCTPTVRGR